MTRKLLQALRTTPATLEIILANQGPEQSALSRKTLPPEEWDIPDVLAHLIAVELLFRARLELIYFEEEPTLRTIAPGAPSDLGRDVAQLLSRFLEEREATLTFLGNLPPLAWERRARRATGEETTLWDQAVVLVEHDLEHMAQIVTLKRLAHRARRSHMEGKEVEKRA